MKIRIFAQRNAKEILRDPINLSFGLGFPLVILLLMSAIQASIPVSLFEIEHLAPGISVFGLSFMTLFSASLISKDRTSSLFQRLYTTPMTSLDFIVGYTLPILPLSVAQGVITYALSLLLGLAPTVNVLLSVLFIIPISILYIALGLLCGALLNDKQVGGICGALLTNLSAWLSGVWFDLELVGGVFKSISYALPFVHAVEMQRAVVAGSLGDAFAHLPWVLGYALATLALAVWCFLRQMKRQ